jgi:hypothetical protein
MNRYRSVHINNLEIIAQKALALVPKQRLDHTSLFYLENNKELFLSIPELREELIKLNTDGFYYLGEYVKDPFEVYIRFHEYLKANNI